MKVKGFTPVVDSIREDVGGGAALIYGVMWRYAQQHALRVCTARQKVIAERAGCTRETVIKHQKALCEAGYIHPAGVSTGGVRSWACNVDITGEVYMGVGEWDVDNFDTPLVEKPDTKKKEDSKKDILDFMVANSIRAEEFDMTWLPVDVSSYLLPFSVWFFRTYGREVTKSERGYWIKTARMWREAGYKPEQVMLAVDYCMEQGTVIKSPQSITWAFDQLNMTEAEESVSREM